MYAVLNNQPRTFVKAYHDVLMSPGLNPTDKLVYLTLLSYQEAGLQVFPSNEHVAKSLGLSKSTVIRSTGALEKAGLITKIRRFNNSNLVTVNPVEVSKCNVLRCQSATSRGVKMTSYKNTDNNKDKISLENEGLSQNIKASLSQGNGLSKDTDLTVDDFISDESVSGLNLTEQKSEQKDEDVTETYASMPSDPFEDEDELTDFNNDSMVLRSEDYITANFEDEPDLTDKDDESTTSPVGLYNDLKTPEQSYHDLLHKSANRITALNKKPKQFNRSQSYRSNPNY
ncbi:helix-turn-helix domain-containing protein [Pantoea sp. GbtcB22]|uniref:helix-turn-helix domain-containing protein n=1 Tax=Pantoea sp. GbtcB22 TaxID=2824767 RepID=UPI001C3038BA|nr:helix-turn-helix domain-containing protein [Pantoea sp. GbtcB22]